MDDKYRLFCCGSRGSRSIEGHKFNEFGGYTSCYVLRKNDYALVIDCGTGFYAASSIISECRTIDVVLTHMHYDHILGLLDWGSFPKNADVKYYAGFSEWFGEDSFREFFKAPFWPVAPDFDINEIPEKGNPLILNNSLALQFYPAPHPNGSKLITIRQDYFDTSAEKMLVIMFDCEKSDGLPKDAIRNCSLLLYDGMYDDEEYSKHVGWGHSTWQEGVRLAREVKPGRLIITHHAPDRMDEALRSFENRARELYPATDFARSGQEWDFPIEKPGEGSEKGKETAEPHKGFAGRAADGIKKKIDKMSSGLSELVLDKKRLSRLSLIISCTVLGGVAAFMTVVNLFTGKTALMISTLVFSLLCFFNVLLITYLKASKAALRLFQAEILVLLSFFVVSGTPEGFSAIWILLIPSAGMFVFGRKETSILCAAMLAILVFFFQTQPGRGFLMYDYTESFMLRFPMAFVAFYLLSYFLETVRSRTLSALNELKDSQEMLISKQTAELRDQNFELMQANSRLAKAGGEPNNKLKNEPENELENEPENEQNNK